MWKNWWALHCCNTVLRISYHEYKYALCSTSKTKKHPTTILAAITYVHYTMFS